MEIDPRYFVRTPAQLENLYGPALERSVRKQFDHLDEYGRAFIAASPIVIVGTRNRSRFAEALILY